MLKNISLLLLLTAILPATVDGLCSPNDEEFFVTFHPHLDAFWLNTDDQLKDINFRPQNFLYQMNQRNSKTIFNSMLEAMVQDPKRKYFVTQIVFFKDWFEQIAPAQQEQVRKLFKNSQLEIANGGWVQNDEAVCYFDDIIDQYTIGMNYLYENFGLITKIGWATDSFGHSHSQAAVEHLLGIDMQGIERVDDRYIYKHAGGPELEFYWQAVSDSNARSYGGVATHIRHFLHEVNNLRAGATDAYARDFIELKQNMKKMYKMNKHFRFLGNDFEEFVTSEFVNLEKTFDLLNRNGKPDCPEYKYGNPTDYLNKLSEYYSSKPLPVRMYDLMSNWDQGHYWTGYYTTEPDLKIICKDYSRLVNLFRKIFVKKFVLNPKLMNFLSVLTKAEELLSVMQHHDGITATSKLWIQNTFKKRMEEMTSILVDGLAALSSAKNQQACQFHKTGVCVISKQAEELYLTVMHEGSPKQQRVELKLPKDYYYDIRDMDEDCLCDERGCTLVFQAKLVAGRNDYTLKHVERPDYAVNYKKVNSYSSAGYTVDFTGDGVKYMSKDNNFMRWTYMRAEDRQMTMGVDSWDKYGNLRRKGQSKLSGIYIMANDGELVAHYAKFTGMFVAAGQSYTKIHFQGETTVTLTIKNSEDGVVDYETTFRPDSPRPTDYFLQMDSNVKDTKEEFYHDMNGYLVSRRKINYRPDYTATFDREDKLNANVYPACSFAYIKGSELKLVAFLDRAQGVTIYNQMLVFNLDRETGDDYKGANQGYNAVVQNTFKYRFAITALDAYPERQWQKEYDDANIAFISIELRNSPSRLLQQTPRNLKTVQEFQQWDYIKFSVAILNEEEIVFRLTYLGQNAPARVTMPGANAWSIPELEIKWNYVDIKESFANGIPLAERRTWVNIPNEINVSSAAAHDQPGALVFQPLQIRSFRINFKAVIDITKASNGKIASIVTLDVPEVLDSQPKPSLLSQRCF